MKEKISYEVLDNIPVFKCSTCSKCTSFEGKNKLNVNRGCCFYFPKFYLIDIKNITNIDISFLSNLIEEERARVHSFYIEVEGIFDKESYKNFMLNNTEEELAKYKNFDISLLFKKCYFSTNEGCSINFELRPHPCNLYLCRKIIEECGTEYYKYSRERKDYYAYCNYINEVLEIELRKRNTDLKNNFKDSIQILKNTKVDNFDFSILKDIFFNAI